MGVYPAELVSILEEADLLPQYSADELEIIKNNTVDFLGVNYYQPLRVQAPSKSQQEGNPLILDIYFEPYDMPGKKSILTGVGKFMNQDFMILPLI